MATSKSVTKTENNTHLKVFQISFGPESYIAWAIDQNQAVEFTLKVRRKFRANLRVTEKKELTEIIADQKHSSRPTTPFAEGKVYFRGIRVWPFDKDLSILNQ